MNKKLAIKGHPIRNKEVIELLEMMGGKNFYEYDGKCIVDIELLYFFIADDNFIRYSSIFNDNFVIFTLEEFEEKFPYKVGDKVRNLRTNDIIGRITNAGWDTEEEIIYMVEWDDKHKSTLPYFSRDLQPYKEETMEEQIKIDIPQGYKFVVVDDDNQQVVFEKVKPQYPKTYKECCEVLMGKTDFQDFDLVLTKLAINRNEENSISPEPPKIVLINNLYKLLICRDAYWKVYSEEMGLGKPWEPSDSEDKYIIRRVGNEVLKSYNISCILEFPTVEMRDAFYKNFKDSIENCKELL